MVIGDRQTGKTTVCIDTILNQKEFYDAGEPRKRDRNLQSHHLASDNSPCTSSLSSLFPRPGYLQGFLKSLPLHFHDISKINRGDSLLVIDHGKKVKKPPTTPF